MHILLTNDDGIYAPGLRALRGELLKLGKVTVVAPATEQSAVGHSITLMTPLLVQEIYDDKDERIGWAVEGKPADCVKLALIELLSEPPDLVVSGINAGSNAGINVLYSGTVAAAIEGSFFGVTSVAVSLEYTDPLHLNFSRAAPIARTIIEFIVQQKPKAGALLNVNIPSLELGDPKGVRVAQQGIKPYEESYERRRDPRGREYFWITPDFRRPPEDVYTDMTALAEHYITITPLKYDMTDHPGIETYQAWNWPKPQGANSWIKPPSDG
jgi:5'-nucleotidase